MNTSTTDQIPYFVVNRLRDIIYMTKFTVKFYLKASNNSKPYKLKIESEKYLSINDI